MIGLIDRATVLGPSDDDGDFTVPLTEGLACRFAHLRPRETAAGVAAGPGGIVADRRLLWDPASAVITDAVRIVVETSNSLPTGDVFQVVPGTIGAYRGPTGALVFRSAYLVRAG